MATARRIRLAVLLDKPARREEEIGPEYVGFTTEDHWVVGYGLDSDGLDRNFPTFRSLNSPGSGRLSWYEPGSCVPG